MKKKTVRRALDRKSTFERYSVGAPTKSLLLAVWSVWLGAALGSGCPPSAGKPNQPASPQGGSTGLQAASPRSGGHKTVGAAVFKSKEPANERIAIDAMEVQHDRMKETDFKRKLAAIKAELGRAGLCRELALAEASMERLRTNYEAQNEPRSAHMADGAHDLITSAHARAGCVNLWFNRGKQAFERKDFEKAALFFALSARYLEISLHRYRNKMDALKKQLDTRDTQNPTRFCTILEDAYRTAMQRQRAAYKQRKLYLATMEASAAQLLKATRKQFGCKP